jgi:predicted amidophosphoribosyltransferase
VAGGDYDSPLRELILAYKEHGRRGLAAPLGDRLAAVVRAGWPASGPLALVPVPATAAAIRARHGDHMLRLARRAALHLRAAGIPTVVASPLRALPRADSAHLDREQRAAAARTAFAVRWRSPVRVAALASAADAGAVVLVDDVLTTGATLAAAAELLLDVGVPVTFAATLAATRRHG